MIDSILPFYKKSKNKLKKNFKFNKLNLFQFFIQRYGIGKKISIQIFLFSGLHKSIKFEYVENKNYYVLLRYKDFFIIKNTTGLLNRELLKPSLEHLLRL